ncbi:hypothetical protein EH165_03850 [Nakamurella antarctica]|uniref:Uncharacterized protein n=1 Tax=Nakamurella antarctica TaxID=1902245 RepID=A0A3G8ZUM3_9ACTN|nr:hypothetical protein [Nakamurella antarctica]AZI57421.1 hypothetical protein EH165_03850 [Nakamurella antarctica]
MAKAWSFHGGKRQTAFSTFAVTCIHTEIRDAWEAALPLSVPLGRKSRVIRAAVEAFAVKNVPVDYDQIAVDVNLTVADVKEIQAVTAVQASLEFQYSNGATLKDSLSGVADTTWDEVLAETAAETLYSKLLAKCDLTSLRWPEVSVDAFRLFFGGITDMGLIGATLGVSTQQVKEGVAAIQTLLREEA